MFDFRRWGGRAGGSKDAAKDRLRLVLMYDRKSLSPEMMSLIKDEMVQVISKYMEIDAEGVQVDLDQEREQAMLVASVPVRQVRRGAAAPPR
ncbi:cell division topological specificity factor MinE [Limnochorda pilosa]|uniref:Cell division topological specificity factor n=1 Tax=Limnochorda pilosa TaxID=1555112 RepID=A0A0K2SNA5_LIMPI|nr:cell division topological specificity factor MinE [Limnochorda pilosa]BAS28613.1 cell division topological specificity factor [Limnochorda pilosa]